MKNLENIPKKNIFEVPDGYFDKLPGIIQSRTAPGSSLGVARPYLKYALQYALPVVVLAAATIFILTPASDPVEKILSSVSTEQMEVFLIDGDSGFSFEDLLDQFEFDEASIEAIELEAYSSFELDLLDLDSVDYLENSDFLEP